MDEFQKSLFYLKHAFVDYFFACQNENGIGLSVVERAISNFLPVLENSVVQNMIKHKSAEHSMSYLPTKQAKILAINGLNFATYKDAKNILMKHEGLFKRTNSHTFTRNEKGRELLEIMQDFQDLSTKEFNAVYKQPCIEMRNIGCFQNAIAKHILPDHFITTNTTRYWTSDRVLLKDGFDLACIPFFNANPILHAELKNGNLVYNDIKPERKINKVFLTIDYKSDRKKNDDIFHIDKIYINYDIGNEDIVKQEIDNACENPEFNKFMDDIFATYIYPTLEKVEIGTMKYKIDTPENYYGNFQ